MDSVITDNIETGKENDNVEMIEEVNTGILSNITPSRPTTKRDYCKVLVPTNRMKPLKENWPTIVKALVDATPISGPACVYAPA